MDHSFNNNNNDNNNNNNINNNKLLCRQYPRIGLELSGSPSTGVGQTNTPDTIQNSSTDDRIQGKLRKLRRDKQVEKGQFSNSDGNKLC